MTPSILEVHHLSIAYQTNNAFIRAVEDVSLSLSPGSSVGLVGESGSGKSTLALGMMRILPATGQIDQGTVRLNGEDLLAMDTERFRRDIRWKELAMVFQSAMNSLNPVMRVGTQLVRACRLHAPTMPRRDAEQRVVELFDAVGLSREDVQRYPHELSGGMRQRAIIALSLVANPHILIADEATTALDVLVQDQILHTLRTLQAERHLSLLVISHDIDVIAKVCDQVLVMYAGRIVEQGPAEQVLERPLHPYTTALLAALPSLTGPRRRLASLPSLVDRTHVKLAGCRFAPRCPLAAEICWRQEPSLPETAHAARCHFAGDSRLGEIYSTDA